jgi:hypothetical protein
MEKDGYFHSNPAYPTLRSRGLAGKSRLLREKEGKAMAKDETGFRIDLFCDKKSHHD